MRFRVPKCKFQHVYVVSGENKQKPPLVSMQNRKKNWNKICTNKAKFHKFQEKTTSSERCGRLGQGNGGVTRGSRRFTSIQQHKRSSPALASLLRCWPRAVSGSMRRERLSATASYHCPHAAGAVTSHHWPTAPQTSRHCKADVGHESPPLSVVGLGLNLSDCFSSNIKF